MKTKTTLRIAPKPLAAALALAGLTAFGLVNYGNANNKDASPAAPANPPVSAALVVEKSITETHEFSGRLEAVEHVDIRARVGGYITAVNFKPGAMVRKGEALFAIDPRPYEAEMVRAEAAAGSARARADLAKLELLRAEKLLAEKAIAQREYDERASGFKELDANARAAQAQFEAARLNVAYTKVLSPIDGRVSKAEITLGNLVDNSAVLTSVVSTDHIYASFDGDEETYLRVSALANQGRGAVVKIGLANEEGFPHSGKLEFVDNQLDTKTGSVRMRATLANADKALVPGLFARVQLSSTEIGKTARLIADRAIASDQDRKYVFVVDAKGKAEYRNVTLGPQANGLRVVRSGLNAGEQVVVNGLHRVRAGEALTVQLIPMSAASSDATLKE